MSGKGDDICHKVLYTRYDGRKRGKEKIKDNEIKSIQYYDTNNTVFYMVPELNFDVFGEHKDKTFIEAYADKAKETNNDAVKLTQFIKTTLKEVLDKGFEKDFEDMVETGLFDSIEETRYNPKTKSNITFCFIKIVKIIFYYYF